MALGNKHPTLLIQKRNKNNITFNFVSSLIDFIQYKFDH